MTTTTMNQPKLSLIADLLARAEDPHTTQAERDLSLQRAQRESARHGIDLAEAAYAAAQRGKPMEPEERRIIIGKSGTRGLRIYTDLFLCVARINDLKNLISSDGSTVWAHGMASDIDMAETIYASLLVQMNVAAEEWLATGEYLGDFNPDDPGYVWSERTYGYEKRRAPNKGVARRNFQRGFIARIDHLLWLEKAEARWDAENAAEEARDAAEPTQNHRAMTTTALALRAKSQAVENFHDKILKDQKIRGSYRGERGPRQSHYIAEMAGRSAADRADTSKRGTKGIGA